MQEGGVSWTQYAFLICKNEPEVVMPDLKRVLENVIRDRDPALIAKFLRDSRLRTLRVILFLGEMLTATVMGFVTGLVIYSARLSSFCEASCYNKDVARVGHF